MLAVFACATFLASMLIFLVQPMLARMLLPEFGGGPAVWNTSMVFFQAALLVGYLLAHIFSRRLRASQQVAVYLVLLGAAALVLPFALPADAAPGERSPALWLLAVLTVCAGAPFAVLSAANPLLQFWFSMTGHRHARDPYFLYAAGNTGSLLGLLAYPFLLERAVDLSGQAGLWAAGYAVLVAGVAACGLIVLRRAPASAQEAPASGEPDLAGPAGASGRLTRPRALAVVGLAIIPSALMLSATAFITAEIASVPLLWVGPLALYLITFIISFSERARVRPAIAGWALAATTLPLAMAAADLILLPLPAIIAAHLMVVFTAGLLCHGRIVELRPEAQDLTAFYLMLSVGGMLGGILTALVAPTVFDNVYEYALVIVAALAVRPHNRLKPARLENWRYRIPATILIGLVAVMAAISTRLLIVGAVDVGQWPGSLPAWGVPVALGGLLAALVHRWPYAAAVGVLLLPMPRTDGEVIARERTFFGVMEVVQNDAGDHHFFHGTTLHGVQLGREGKSPPVAGAYYSAGAPIHDIVDAAQKRPEGLDRVAVVGLGAGAVAAYAGSGERWDFFEIDPEVVRIAQDAELFDFLGQTAADTSVSVRDGRLGIESAEPGSYDLIVLDAFSSDAVPIHLLTTEAWRSYLDALAPGGTIAFHSSSKHLRLTDVVAANAAELDLASAGRWHSQTTGTQARSIYTVVARNQRDLDGLLARDGWQPVPRNPDVSAWTDDRVDVLSIVAWRGVRPPQPGTAAHAAD